MSHPPLSVHVRAALRDLSHKARPAQSFNPGVVGVLQRYGFVTSVSLPSPYPIHKGCDVEHLSITEAGQKAFNA